MNISANIANFTTNVTEYQTGGIGYAFIIICISILTFFSSVITLSVVIYASAYRSTQGILMSTISVNYILLCLFAFPVSVHFSLHQQWLLDPIWCSTNSILIGQTGLVNIYSLAFMSLDKTLKITFPFSYPSRSRLWHVMISLAVVWVLALLTACMPVFTNSDFYPVNDSYLCVHDLVFYTMLVGCPAVVLYGVCLLVTFCVAKTSIRRIHDSIISGQSQECQQDFKAAKTIALSLGVFLVSYLPLICVMSLNRILKVQIPNIVYFVSYWLQECFNIFNTVFYYQYNSQFRMKSRRLFRVIMNRLGCPRNDIAPTDDLPLHTLHF